MNLDCSQVERIAHTLLLVRECDVVRSGALRLSTPFLYPNGERIDVFLEESINSLFQSMSLSDYGHTSLYLRNAQIDMDATAKKREIATTILSQLGVRHHNGDLFVDVLDPLDLTDPIFRLSQACVRVAEFALHGRLRTANPFRDEVESFISATVPCLTDVQIFGRYQSRIQIDFETFGKSSKSYVCLLSSGGGSSAAHTSANEIFRKWYDLIPQESEPHEKITIYNSASNSVRRSDRQRLQDYSKVVSYPAQAEYLKSLLAA